jgi:hypothetical protein
LPAVGPPDQLVLTGSARLLEDVTRLDQCAFDTDRRKLHLAQRLPQSEVLHHGVLVAIRYPDR